MSVIIDFAIFPMDKGESLSPYVARAIKVINESGLPHKLHWFRGNLYVIEDVEAEVCTECGERYFHAKVLDNIDTLLEKDHIVKENIAVEVVSLEEQCSEHLGTRMTIHEGKGKGRVVIEFYSSEDFARLQALLLGR